MMKIGKKFNELSFEEYFQYIKAHKQYSDFNTLGLYRSIIENEQLSQEEKIEVREFAHEYFRKTFDFLVLKDPVTYMGVCTLELGRDMSRAEIFQFWNKIQKKQEQILKDKKIRHRNFGRYSKHECGDDNCPLNGIMIKQGSPLAEYGMRFTHDKNHFVKKQKSERRKKDRKNQHQLIRKDLEA